MADQTIDVFFKDVRDGASATLSGGGDGTPRSKKKSGSNKVLAFFGKKLFKLLGPLAVLMKLDELLQISKLLVFFVGFSLLKIFKWVWQGIEALINLDWSSILAVVWEKIVQLNPILGMVVSAVKTVWNWVKILWNGLKAFFANPVEFIRQGMLDVWNFLKEKLPFLEKVEVAIKWVWEVLKQTWEGLKVFFSDPVGIIKQAFSNVWELLKQKLPFLQKVEDWVKKTYDNIKTTITNFFKDPGKVFKDALQFIWDVLTSLPQKIWDLVQQLGTTIVNGIKSALGFKIGVQDAIITKRGDVIRTDPNDTIFATKNPNGMGGGQKVFNFYGVTSSEMLDVLKRELAEDVNIAGRF